MQKQKTPHNKGKNKQITPHRKRGTAKKILKARNHRSFKQREEIAESKTWWAAGVFQVEQGSLRSGRQKRQQKVRPNGCGEKSYTVPRQFQDNPQREENHKTKREREERPKSPSGSITTGGERPRRAPRTADGEGKITLCGETMPEKGMLEKKKPPEEKRRTAPRGTCCSSQKKNTQRRVSNGRGLVPEQTPGKKGAPEKGTTYHSKRN